MLRKLMIAAVAFPLVVGPPQLMHVRQLPKGVVGCHPGHHKYRSATAPRQIRQGERQPENARADNGGDCVEACAAPAAVTLLIDCLQDTHGCQLEAMPALLGPEISDTWQCLQGRQRQR